MLYISKLKTNHFGLSILHNFYPHMLRFPKGKIADAKVALSL